MVTDHMLPLNLNAGAGSALLGKEAAMACTVAVEEAIVEHYNRCRGHNIEPHAVTRVPLSPANSGNCWQEMWEMKNCYRYSEPHDVVSCRDLCRTSNQ